MATNKCRHAIANLGPLNTSSFSWYALPSYIHLPVCFRIMDPHSRAPKKNISHGNEVLPQDITNLIQRPCYQRGSLCQVPTGDPTTRRPPDHRNETQPAVVWSFLPFIRSGQIHLARHSERGKKTGQTEWRGRNTTSGNGQAWSSPIPRGQWRTWKMEETGRVIICGAPTTLAVEG